MNIRMCHGPDDDAPEGTGVGGDGEPIAPGDSDPYPAGG